MEAAAAFASEAAAGASAAATHAWHLAATSPYLSHFTGSLGIGVVAGISIVTYLVLNPGQPIDPSVYSSDDRNAEDWEDLMNDLKHQQEPGTTKKRKEKLREREERRRDRRERRAAQKKRRALRAADAEAASDADAEDGGDSDGGTAKKAPRDAAASATSDSVEGPPTIRVAGREGTSGPVRRRKKGRAGGGASSGGDGAGADATSGSDAAARSSKPKDSDDDEGKGDEAGKGKGKKGKGKKGKGRGRDMSKGKARREGDASTDVSDTTDSDVTDDEGVEKAVMESLQNMPESLKGIYQPPESKEELKKIVRDARRKVELGDDSGSGPKSSKSMLRSLDCLVYVVLIAAILYVLNAEYGFNTFTWLKWHFPRESAVFERMGGNVRSAMS